MGKFTIKTDAKGEFRFNLEANNGQIILSSEGYKNMDGCNNGIESVRKNAADSTKFEKKDSTNGKFYFNLKAGNGQIIGSSQMYDSEAGRDNGIASVMTNAPEAKVETV
jgi:uncharacterized protein YegP (UPF0339 family)